MTYSACIPIILQSEGGYVDNPRDPGGPTNMGITLETLSGWLGRPATIGDVQNLTTYAASQIYCVNYYNPAHGPDVPGGVDLMVFDAAVNSGVSAGIRLLQTAVGVASDGFFGPITKAAAQAKAPADTISAYHDARATFYQSMPTFSIFGAGWLARNDRTRDLALSMLAKNADV